MLDGVEKGHTHDLGGILSQPTFRWYEHIARIALSLIGQYGLCVTYLVWYIYDSLEPQWSAAYKKGQAPRAAS